MLNPIPTLRNATFWSRLPVSYRGAIIIAIPAICLMATLGAWVGTRQVGLATLKQIEHTEAVIDQSNQVLMLLLDAETGVRGYYIDRDEEFLAPYRYARSSLPEALQQLEQLLLENNQQTQPLTEIKQLVEQEMALLEQKVERSRQRPLGNNYTEQDRILLQRGKTVMDSIRTAIAMLKAEEREILKIQQEDLKQLRAMIGAIQGLTAWISAFAYWAAVYLFSKLDRDLQERDLLLEENKTFIETITTNVVDGVITLTKPHQIETINPAAADMFDYQASEVIGQDLAMLLVDPAAEGEERREKVDFWHESLLESERRWQTSGYRKDGTMFPVEISVSELEPDDRLMVIVRDVTENEMAKAKLKNRADELARLSAILAKANTELERRNQELDRFAYVASHDLKAPLRAIASLSEWIEEDLDEQLEGETRYQMELLRGRVHRLENLINGLLEYSRVGRVANELEPVDVRELLDDIIDSLAPPDAFKIEIASEMPVLQTYKVPLRQIFSNLISNAIKHHHCPIGEIKITAEEIGLFYRFAVTDNGPGIPPEYFEKIFVIFQTLFARDTKENTGIGLAIVKKILEHHGGTIELESNPDSGTTFYFTWPK